MSGRFVLGIDIGSRGGRCALVNTDTLEMVCTRGSWTHPQVQNSIGVYDLDIDGIWHILKRNIQSAMAQAKVSPQQVIAIATASMRYGLVMVDKSGQVAFAIPNIDGRAAMAGAHLAATRGDEFYERTGHWPGPVFAAARLQQLQQDCPALIANAQAFCSVSDWVAFRLSGKIATDLSHASGTMLFDVERQIWCEDLIASLGLPGHIFPEVRRTGQCLGHLLPAVASELGLPAGIPIVMGGADTQASLLGCGAVKGDICIVGGTTAPVQQVIGAPLRDHAHLWTEHHILPEQWVLESNGGPVGATLDFMAKLLYGEHSRAAAMLCATAREARVGAGGVVSTVGSGVFDAREMRVPVGHLTLAPMLYAAHHSPRSHVARALLEGIVYGLYANVEQLVAASQMMPQVLRLTGGLSQSSLLAQMLSDLSAWPVEVMSIGDTTASGAALCAGVGVGAYDDLSSAMAVWTKAQTPVRYIPDQERQAAYRNLYDSWQGMADASVEPSKLASEMALQAISESYDDQPVVQAGFRPRIFVSADLDAASLEALRRMGEVTYQSYRDAMQLLTGDALIEALEGYHVLITEVDVIDTEALQALKDLKAVVACRGNVVNVDIAACTALGIPVLHTPGRNASAVADLTVAFILMLSRHMTAATQFLHGNDVEAGDIARMGMAHEHLQGHELWRQTIGLIGMGAVGRKVIERLTPFGAEIVVYDPLLSPEDIIATGARAVTLPELLATSDVVSLHAAVTDSSRQLISKTELKQMKTHAFFVNTARAALVNETDLFEVLTSGHLGGAALDVFAVEPPGTDHPLLSLSNVIATPHIAGNTVEVSAHQGQVVVRELQRLLEGRQPHHVQNPDVLETFSWTRPRQALTATAVEGFDPRCSPAVTDLEQGADEAPSPSQRTGVFSKLREMIPGYKARHQPHHVPTTRSSDAANALEHVIRYFLELASKDEALRTFCVRQDILVQFIIPDSAQYFYFHYQHGDVITGWGVAESKPDVTLKMTAAILDGVQTGQINGVRAAMTGRLSFSGDTVKAMRLQKINKDIVRLYCRAREEIGNPGDLSNLDEEGQRPTTSPARPVWTPESTASARQASGPQGAEDERDDAAHIFNELYHAGLVTATGGNVSVRVAHDATRVWITPSQVFKGGIERAMMVPIDLEGNQLDDDIYTASSERLLHTLILKQRPQIQAVIHTHAPRATVLALSELPFLPISTEAALIGEIPRVPFMMPGSRELAEEVAAALGDRPAVLLQNHGLVVAADTLRQAADWTLTIERTADQILQCYAVGKVPPVLPRDTVDLLQALGGMDEG